MAVAKCEGISRTKEEAKQHLKDKGVYKNIPGFMLTPCSCCGDDCVFDEERAKGIDVCHNCHASFIKEDIQKAHAESKPIEPPPDFSVGMGVNICAECVYCIREHFPSYFTCNFNPNPDVVDPVYGWVHKPDLPSCESLRKDLPMCPNWNEKEVEVEVEEEIIVIKATWIDWLKLPFDALLIGYLWVRGSFKDEVEEEIVKED